MENTKTAGARILVVDDDKEVAFAIGKIIERRGHEVKIVHDGLAVLDTAHAFNPQALVLDLGLPGKDGYEIIGLIRQDDDLKDMRIVVVSGHDHASDRQKTREAGADQHLSKPVNFEKLLTILADVTPTGE